MFTGEVCARFVQTSCCNNGSTGVQNPCHRIIAISLQAARIVGGGGGVPTALSKTMYTSAIHNVHKCIMHYVAGSNTREKVTCLSCHIIHNVTSYG